MENIINKRVVFAEKAKQHTELMSKKHDDEIEDCVWDTVLYEPADIDNKIVTGTKNTKIEIVDNKIIDELFCGQYAFKGYHSTVLNFANFVNPGGGFLNGAMAQEESLCHNSFLYNVLSHKRFERLYYQNNLAFNELYANRILYSPNILFEKGCQTRLYDVITCAAPNAAMAEEMYGCSKQQINAAMESRINAILNVAYKNSVQNLYLGAFGCGCFGNDPWTVAKIFKKMLETKYKNVFQYVAFVIPDSDINENYKAFWNVLGKPTALEKIRTKIERR